MSIFLKLFQEIAEGTLPNSFYMVTITLISKPGKDSTQKGKLQANITDEHRCKSHQKNLANRIQRHIKKLIHHNQIEFIPVMQSVSSVAQLCLTLRPHGLQHTRLPCPSPTLRAYSKSCQSSQ